MAGTVGFRNFLEKEIEKIIKIKRKTIKINGEEDL